MTAGSTARHGNYRVEGDNAWDHESFRVGMIEDWGCGTPPLYDQYDAQQLAFDEALESGLIDRPVEQVIAEIHGPPFYTTDTVIDAYVRIAQENRCIAMIGPRMTDNAVGLAKVDLAAKLGIPTLTDAGSRLHPNEWTFGLPNGTFMDESTIMVNYLVRQGVKKIGVIREDNPIGDEYMDFIRPAARRLGATITAEFIVPTTFDEASAAHAVEFVRDSRAEGLLYTGFGSSSLLLLKAVRESGWDSPRVTNSIFMATIPELGYGQVVSDFEGWAGIDQFDERNPYFQRFLDSFEARYGRRPVHCYSCLGYDFGRVIAEGLANAKPLSRAGLRDGLERIRLLPAATGSAGTYISYARYDHRGFKGPYFVVREVRDGKNILSPFQGFDFS